jgi:aquaporin Z
MLAKPRRNWPEYLIEAWALGTFMVSAGVCTMLLEHPASPLRTAIADADLRRALVGLCMGLTAVALIYSPWGKRSGAHMNPAVTLTFLRLGKVSRVDASFFVLAQFAGGTLGVLLVTALAGSAFTAPPVSSVVTLPTPPHGSATAFVAEVVIAFGMMATILTVSNSRLAAYTGLFAGLLVAAYITLEGPLSGMSINPARSFASAAPSGTWERLWIYFVAPPLGMLAAAQLHGLLHGRVGCAKLLHPADVRCIHCGYEPAVSVRSRGLVGESIHG